MWFRMCETNRKTLKNLRKNAKVFVLRGEIESGFHLSGIYYRKEICANCVKNLK